MSDANLPVWALWIQAIGIPITGAVIAGVGVYIARQQKRLADIKLQNDLYDRRYKIYEAVRKFLVEIQTHGNVSLEDFFAFRRGTSDAVFLLQEDIVEYLKKIGDEAVRLRYFQERLRNENLTPEARGTTADNAADLENWFAKQFDVLVAKFQSSMRLDKHALN
jgi:hypothetical protein